MLPYKNVRVVEVGKSHTKKTKVTALCNCGKEFDVILSDLKNGNHKTCGHGKEKHGMKKTRQYKIWQDMRYRCSNPKNTVYKYYGAKGVKVCERWQKSFISFWEDMKDGYSEELTIDRIDSNGDYCHENCRWATVKEQRRNMSSNVTYKGECAAEASERLGGHKTLVTDRIYRGWTKEKAFTIPLKKNYENNNNIFNICRQN